tara:strand:- start:412 stop:531 length:120 start_codon:yes stop_codon:yes gene_type:complete
MTGTIVVNASSIRVLLIMILSVIWFYLLNEELRSGDEGK